MPREEKDVNNRANTIYSYLSIIIINHDDEFGINCLLINEDMELKF